MDEDTSVAEVKAGSVDLIGGELCLDFTNTVGNRGSDYLHDYLVSYAALLAWSEHVGLLPHPTARGLREIAEKRPADAKRVLERATVLREALFRILSNVSTGRASQSLDLLIVNENLAHALSHRRIVRSQSAFEWGWQASEGALDQMLWPITRSAADLLTSDRLSRVRECEGDPCGWLFIDSSKNHSRRWCSMGDCGNRAKAQRFYARHSQN